MRNSEKRTAEDSDMSDGNQDVSALLADLKKQLAEVTSGSFDRDETPKRFQKKKERLAKENKSKFNIEPQHTSTWRRTPRASARCSVNSSNNSPTTSNSSAISSTSSSRRNTTTTNSSITTNKSNSTTTIIQDNSSSSNSREPSQDNWFKVVGSRNLTLCSTNLETPWAPTLMWIPRPTNIPPSLN